VRAAETAGFQLAIAGARPVPGAVHLGLLSPEALAWAYSAADCVVFPTRYEACSYVVLEALASGVPLVTTPVGWARDLGRRLPDYQPLLAPPDASAIAGAMRRALEEDLRPATDAARQLVISHNSLPRFAQQWREVAAIGSRQAVAST
jgi:glycosyltransferase involved in cell wall biosynthesis